MGLTIHFELRLPGLTTESEVDATLGHLRAQAERMPFDFVAPFGFGSTMVNGMDLLEIVSEDICEPLEGDAPPMFGDATTTRAIITIPGEECEPAHFGFLRRTSEDRVGSEWFWRCHCKTQYASNVGDEHFVDSHLRVITLLDYAVSLGIRVWVGDETGYWDHRDRAKLLASLAMMNHLMAAFAGRLADALGPERSMEAPIFEHPRFEHLEMGEVLGHDPFIRSALRPVLIELAQELCECRHRNAGRRTSSHLEWRGKPHEQSCWQVAVVGAHDSRLSLNGELVRSGKQHNIQYMGAPLLDFSHLTAEQRIELAEQLWDSLDPVEVEPSEADTALLRTRRAELARDGEPGTPWRDTIEDLRKRGG